MIGAGGNKLPARRIVGSAAIQGSDRRWAYTLECGHTVNRRQNSSKRVCLCGFCKESSVACPKSNDPSPPTNFEPP